MIQKSFLIGFSVAASVALSGCGGSGSSGGSSTNDNIIETSSVNMMSDYSTPYYANLSTGENVTDDSWHFSYLKGVGFKTNREAEVSVCIAKTYSALYSDSSPVQAEFEALTASNTLADFESVSLSDCEANDYITDTVESQFKDWYTYDSETHVVTVNVDSSNGWIVRTADGNSYARLTATAYSGGVTFDVENWNGSAFTTAVSTGNLDYSSGTVFYNIEDNTNSTTEFSGWDIKIEQDGYGHNIYVNGGESGDGEAGIGYVLLNSAADVTDPTDSSQIYKYYGDAATGAMSQPGDYGALEMIGYQMWPTFAVYIFKEGDKYYKAQIVSNYGSDGAQESGNHVIRYAELISAGDSSSAGSTDSSSAGETITFDMDATDSSVAVYADLSIGATVTDDSWQIAYQKYVGFKSNSNTGISICVAKTYDDLYSDSSPVQAEFEALTASNTLADFESVSLSDCEANDYLTDGVESQFTDWHTSGSEAEIVNDPAINGWIVRTADGNSYARIKALTMADGELTFSVELWNGTSFDAAITTEPLAYYMEDTYYDIETNTKAATEFDGWDLKFTNIDHYPGIFVNGGASGNGTAGVGALQVTTADDVTDPTDTEQVYKYFGDSASGALNTPGDFGPFEYSVASMHQMWPTFAVYIVKDGDTYYKMQVLGNYGSDGSLQSGNLVIRYAKFE
jgi:hypothetical protein